MVNGTISRPAVSLHDARWMAKLMNSLAKQGCTGEQFRAALDERDFTVIERKREGAAHWGLVAWAEDITQRDGHFFDERGERIV